jgi:hypothetical protein
VERSWNDLVDRGMVLWQSWNGLVIHIERDGKLEIIKLVVSRFLIVKSILVFFQVPRFALLTFNKDYSSPLINYHHVGQHGRNHEIGKGSNFQREEGSISNMVDKIQSVRKCLWSMAEKDLPTTEDNEAEINVDQQAAVKRNSTF